MMRFAVLPLCVGIGLVRVSAVGQEVAGQPTPAEACWMAGVAFSSGAAVRVSGSVMACGESGTWVDANQDAAAGCFFNGAFYSTGARAEVPGIPEIKTICIQNGTWREFAADEQPQPQGGGRRAGQ